MHSKTVRRSIIVLFSALLLLLAPAFVEPAIAQETDPDEDREEITYVVRRGDTLSHIAASFDTTINALLAENPQIIDPSRIFIGQELTIPEPDQDTEEVIIAPTNGLPGTDVQLRAVGFAPNAQVEIGVGRENSEFDVVETAQTDAQGSFETQVRIPAYADAEERWVIVVRDPLQGGGGSGPVTEVSNTFYVTDREGVALFDTVNVYLVALGDQGRSGQLIGCEDSLVPVQQEIEPTVAPLQSALELLLINDPRIFPDTGLYNALSHSDLSVESIDIENGEATIIEDMPDGKSLPHRIA